MSLLLGSVATLAVATIYCLWQTEHVMRQRREQTLRERVAYLLWVVAEQSPETGSAADLTIQGL